VSDFVGHFERRPGGRSGEQDPYERLLEMIEQELELAGQGRFVELHRASLDRSAFSEGLPAVPPASATAAIERALLLHKRLQIELQRGREALLRQAHSLARGERADRGYRGPPAGAGHISATA
jgi:hypothetical protein